VSCTAEGFQRIGDDVLGDIVARVIDARMTRPGGPAAPLS
jgi:hypothetical protein